MEEEGALQQPRLLNAANHGDGCMSGNGEEERFEGEASGVLKDVDVDGYSCVIGLDDLEHLWEGLNNEEEEDNVFDGDDEFEGRIGGAGFPDDLSTIENEEGTNTISTLVPYVPEGCQQQAWSNIDENGEGEDSWEDTVMYLDMDSDTNSMTLCDRFKPQGSFNSVSEFKQLLFQYAIRMKSNIKYISNKPRYYNIICKTSGCGWKLTAGSVGKSNRIVIRTITEHVHNAEEILKYKPEIPATYMGAFYRARLKGDHDGWNPVKLHDQLRAETGAEISYMQAFRAHEAARVSLSGKYKETYVHVPFMCELITDQIPGSLAECRISTCNRFEQLFVAYGTSICGFKNACRPIVFTDACHRTDGYGGMLLSAISLDADQGLWPIAYSFASAENDLNWEWFFQKLKQAIGEHEFVVMSDRHGSLKTAVSKVFGREKHSWCLRHLTDNFCQEMRRLRLKSPQTDLGKKLLNAVAYASDERAYTIAIMELEMFNADLRGWVNRNNPEHWANAKFPYRRWGWLNSNPAESYNNWLGKRNLRGKDIFCFMKDHLIELSNFMDRKITQCKKWKNNCGRKIEKLLKGKLYMAEHNNYSCASSKSTLMYTVEDGIRRYRVDIRCGRCSCGEWQMTGIPCPHVAACAKLPNSPSIYTLLDRQYCKDTQELLLSNYLPPVEMFENPDDDLVKMMRAEGAHLNRPAPPSFRRPPGRPRKKRYPSQVLLVGESTVKCGRCRDVGHNARTCKRPRAE